jgi:hypothetical protein
MSQFKSKVPFTKNPNLPIRNGPVRFAVGPPDGVTSNSWKCWVEKSGVYIACRDNFQEAKVSLHTGGRWRMGFTTEAVKKYPGMIAVNQNRAWQVWNEPPAILPGTVIAFRLSFLTSELAVRPEQRSPAKWKDLIYIEAAPEGSGKMTVVTLFVANGNVRLKHESEPSLCLASLATSENRRAILVAHGEPEGELPLRLTHAVNDSIDRAEKAGVRPPQGAYGYFFGESSDGWRYIFGARIFRRW